MLRCLALTVIAMYLACSALAQAPVRVATATLHPIRTHIDVPGTANSLRTASLSTAVAGMVADLSVDVGARVKRGDTLAALDGELVRLALERLSAQLKQREVALADARRRFEEAREVGPEKGIARTTIESLRAAVAIEEAALAAAQAERREQRALLARHTVKAPFDGVISARFSELGEWLNPGDAVFDLVALDNLRFDFRVAQDYSAQITPATPIALRYGDVGEPIRARIDAIVPVKDPTTRTFLVRVIIDPAINSDAQPANATPGMSAAGRFTLASGRRGIAVSRDAILRFPDGRTTAWVVKDVDGTPQVRERRVITGTEFDGLIEITRGLEVGDIVVVRGNETLQEGQSVVILTGED